MNDGRISKSIFLPKIMLLSINVVVNYLLLLNSGRTLSLVL